MSTRRFTESMAAHVLTYERSPKRFEDFCVELFRDVEQVEYVRTSSSWDHGRDGRDSSTRSGAVPPFLCSTLEDNVLLKAISDVRRILETGSLERVIICCAAPVSENLSDKVEREIRGIIPDVDAVRVNGREQLSQLSMRFPRAMDNLYAGELAELRGVCAADTSLADEDALTGLRIALTTQLHEDAQKRRSDLVRNLILTALSERSEMNLSEIANSVSHSLHLPRTVHVGFLGGELDALVRSEHVAQIVGRYHIMALGEEEVARRLEEGRSRLSVGAAEMRMLLEQLTGTAVMNEEWKAIWRILEECVSAILLSRGAEIVDEVASIIEGESPSRQLGDFREQIEGIGQRIRALPGGGARLDELAQAVVDMFFEPTTPAFEWLTDLCAIFIDLCGLGLEPRAQEQVIAELRYFALLLDTDIVLSLLSEGEPNHNQLKAVLTGWRGIGGHIFVAPPVLEEASHHAFIAEYDYEPTWRRLHEMSDEDALHEIENVFVRGFRVAAKGKFYPNKWRQYVSAFRGTSDHDYEKILGLIGDDGGTLLPEVQEGTELAARIERQLFNEQKSECSNDPREINSLREKCNRDGRLAALLARERERLEREHRTVVILSTSKVIRRAVELALGGRTKPEPVMHLSAIAWMLSLAPGVRLTLGTLRKVLFDTGFRKHMRPIERLVIRTVRASEQYSLHWSRRNTLQRAVREKLAGIATQRDEGARDVERKVLQQDEGGREILTSVVADALDQMSRSRSEQEIIRLQKRVEELETELRAAHER